MATAQDLVNYCETLLNQTSAMIIAGLPSGFGEIAPNQVQYTIDSNTQLLLWATEGQNRLARLCLPIADTATIVPSVAGADILGPFEAIVSASGRMLTNPTQVSIAGRNLAAANMGFLNANWNWYPATPEGNPTAWSNNNNGIALSNYTSQPTFTVAGYFLPAPLTALTDPIDLFIDDFAQRTIAYYMAWQVAVKGLDNTVVAQRAQLFEMQFSKSASEIYSRLIQQDPTMSAIFPPAPVDSLLQITRVQTPKV